MTLIVDASVAVKWFFYEELHEKALRLLTDDADQLQAPDLVVAEVANTAWKKVIRGEIPDQEAQSIVMAIPHFFRELHPSTQFAEAALTLALTLRHPIYDCLYLACAQTMGAILISADKRLCGAVQGTEFETSIQYLDSLQSESDFVPPLRTPLHKLHHVIALAKNLTETQQNVDEALWGRDESRSREVTFRPARFSGRVWPSTPQQYLLAYLDSLSDDECAELTALCWLGKGYKEDMIEWPTLFQRAHGSQDDKYFIYLISLIDCLETGLAYFRERIAAKTNC